MPHPVQLFWLVPVLIAAAASLLLTGREARLLAKVLLAIRRDRHRGDGGPRRVIFARGGAQPTGMDFSTFSVSGVSVSAVLGGVVAAFLCWRGSRPAPDG